MKESIIVSGFYDEISGNLDKQIAVIKELNQSYLCPRNVNGKNIADYTAEEFIAEVKPVLDKNGVKFSSIGSPIGKIDVNDDEGFEKQKKQLKELVKIAQATDCKYIRVFSFFYGKENPDKCFDKVAAKFRQFLDIARGSGVKLLHENEKKVYGDVPERVLKLYRAMNDESLALCFDASNYVQCDVDAKAAFDMLKDYVEYYHIKDCSKYKVEVPLGLGEGCYDYIFAELKKRGYKGFMTLEPHTFKYALLKPAVNFVPFAALAMSNYFKAFREVDKKMGRSYFALASRKEVFVWQFDNLMKMLG